MAGQPFDAMRRVDAAEVLLTLRVERPAHPLMLSGVNAVLFLVIGQAPDEVAPTVFLRVAALVIGGRSKRCVGRDKPEGSLCPVDLLGIAG